MIINKCRNPLIRPFQTSSISHQISSSNMSSAVQTPQWDVCTHSIKGFFGIYSQSIIHLLIRSFTYLHIHPQKLPVTCKNFLIKIAVKIYKRLGHQSCSHFYLKYCNYYTTQESLSITYSNKYKSWCLTSFCETLSLFAIALAYFFVYLVGIKVETSGRASWLDKR